MNSKLINKLVKKMVSLKILARKTRNRKENFPLINYFGSITTNLPEWYRETGNWCVHPWEDHLSTEKGLVFSEPYELSMTACKALISFCEKRNLTFKITGLSSYYPGRTVLIIIQTRVRNNKI